MRDMRKGICPLCDHHEIVEGVPGEFADNAGELPAAFTYESRWMLSGRNPHRAHGELRYYMCRRCGHVQWFVDAPESVPIGEKFQTRLIAGRRSDTEPYR